MATKRVTKRIFHWDHCRLRNPWFGVKISFSTICKKNYLHCKLAWVGASHGGGLARCENPHGPDISAVDAKAAAKVESSYIEVALGGRGCGNNFNRRRPQYLNIVSPIAGENGVVVVVTVKLFWVPSRLLASLKHLGVGLLMHGIRKHRDHKQVDDEAGGRKRLSFNLIYW